MRTATSEETERGTQARIAELAKDAFGQHALTVLGPGRWKCRRPDSGTYGFYVFIGPGAVMVYGDIGEGIFRMSEPEDGVIPWLRGAVESPDYLLGKLRAADVEDGKQKFYAGDALEWAHQHYVDTVIAVDENDPNAIARVGGDEAKRATEFFIDVKEADEYAELDRHRFLTMANDAGLDDMYGVAMGPSPSALWLVHALTAFVRLYDARASQ